MASQQTQKTIIASIGAGLQLLPFFMQSVETLFGKQTGQTKKQAVHDLFNASAVGAAVGFGLDGSPSTANMIDGFRPVVSAQIDLLAEQMFPTHTPPPAVDASVLPANVQAENSVIAMQPAKPVVPAAGDDPTAATRG